MLCALDALGSSAFPFSSLHLIVVSSVIFSPRAPFERTQMEGFVAGTTKAMTMLCERRLRNTAQMRKALQRGTIVEHLFAVVGARQGASRAVQVSWCRPTTTAVHSTSRFLFPTQPGIAMPRFRGQRILSVQGLATSRTPKEITAEHALALPNTSSWMDPCG